MFLLIYFYILWEECLHVHVNLSFTGKSLILKPCENHLYCRLDLIVFGAMRSEQTVPWHLLMIVKLPIVIITMENCVVDYKGLRFLSFNCLFVCLFVFFRVLRPNREQISHIETSWWCVILFPFDYISIISWHMHFMFGKKFRLIETICFIIKIRF